MSDPERAYDYVRGAILAYTYAGMNAFGARQTMRLSYCRTAALARCKIQNGIV